MKSKKNVSILEQLLDQVQQAQAATCTADHAYLRVSTISQDHAIQEAAIAAYCLGEGITPKMHRDKATGANAHRKTLNTAIYGRSEAKDQ